VERDMRFDHKNLTSQERVIGSHPKTVIRRLLYFWFTVSTQDVEKCV
jgi:hypothetical protein